jgi:hypothetical protein
MLSSEAMCRHATMANMSRATNRLRTMFITPRRKSCACQPPHCHTSLLGHVSRDIDTHQRVHLTTRGSLGGFHAFAIQYRAIPLIPQTSYKTPLILQTSYKTPLILQTSTQDTLNTTDIPQDTLNTTDILQDTLNTTDIYKTPLTPQTSYKTP